MSQTKYNMPPSVRKAVVCHCQGYAETKIWYDTINNSIDSIGRELDGMPRGNATIKITENRALKLAQLDGMVRTQIMKAIEQAYNSIGDDLASDSLREKLKTAIWESTLDARNYPYEVWDLPSIYRDNFYERKRKFLYMIATRLELI